MKKIAFYLKAKLERGHTVEVGSVRYHRYSPSVEVTDLTNAGRHGKKVESFHLGFPHNWEYDNQAEVDKFCEKLIQNNTYDKALSFAKNIVKINSDFSISTNIERGVDVQPPMTQEGSQPIKIETSEFSLEATPLTFDIHDKKDTNNYPVMIPPIGNNKTAIKQFYQWVKLNLDEIKRMTFSQLHHELTKVKIPFHYYLSMD